MKININQWAPEYFTFKIYRKLTEVRVLVFWVLFLFYIIDSIFIEPDIDPFWALKWKPEVFTEITTKMVYLLFAVVGFSATIFAPLAINAIKTKTEAKVVTNIWSNLAKYTIYPFTTAIVIEIVLFLLKVGVNVPALFILLLIFVFLTVNSFFTTIRMAEILINEYWSDKEINKFVKNTNVENYYKGDYRKDGEKRGGWIIGQFMNEKNNDTRGTDKFSVKFWKFQKGQTTNHPPKYQRFATEATFVLKGKLKARIEGDEFQFVAGDYVVIPPNTVSNLATEVTEDTEGITIKAPSCIPDDTIKLSDPSQGKEI